MNALLRAALLALSGMVVAAAFASAIDSDLYWQRALGEFVLRRHTLPATLGSATFSAPDAPWLAHEWIFATCWAIASRAGAEPLFRIACALPALAVIAINAIRSRRATPCARTIALALVVIGMLPSFGLRAQIVAWPLLALVLLALESGPRAAWWTVPIAIAWDNLHASGLIVPVIVIIYGFGLAIRSPRRATLMLTLTLAAATTLAFAATPFGLPYARFAAAWSVNPATNLVLEWQPMKFTTLPIEAGALAIFVLLVVGELRGAHLPWPQRLLALALFAAATLHLRNIALFCIVAGPWAANALDPLLPRQRSRATRTSGSDFGLVALGAVGAACLAIFGGRLARADPENPVAAIARLEARNRPVRVACEDFSWCSRFAGTPNIRVFVDGRLDAYPDPVFTDFRRLLAGDSTTAIARWQINAVIVRRDSPFARSLPIAQWHRIQDGTTQLFVRV